MTPTGNNLNSHLFLYARGPRPYDEQLDKKTMQYPIYTEGVLNKACTRKHNENKMLKLLDAQLVGTTTTMQCKRFRYVAFDSASFREKAGGIRRVGLQHAAFCSGRFVHNSLPCTMFCWVDSVRTMHIDCDIHV